MTSTYKVLITTSGIGERLGDITQYTNKALVKLGKKPVISYIVELYPKDTEFVITTGYFANQVKELLLMCYPNRKFSFIPVDPFSGKGSSLVYSILQAKNLLQCPFIYHASDTVVTEKPLKPKKNWVAGYSGEGASQYASFDMVGDKVEKINDKGSLNCDFLHIGMVGVNDYKVFWDSLDIVYKSRKRDSSLSDIHIINEMINQGSSFAVQKVNEWMDTGNVESLQKARKSIKDRHDILDKLKESIFLFDTSVVKFFYEEKNVSQRVKRAKILKGLVPTVINSSKNYFQYKYAQGDLYSEVANPENFSAFLQWSKKNLWKKTTEVPKNKFKEVCYDFYYNKSVDRIDKFLLSHNLEDKPNIINDETVPTIKDLLSAIDFNWLCSTKQTYFHGDFILDNVIKKKNGFALLDWRQNFGGLLKAGDIYYDLAKLNHNLTVNHSVVNSNLFSIDIDGQRIKCDIYRKDNLVECQDILFEFIKKEGYDLKKVKVLTGLIWLNMSPLHHHPFDLFLYYFGKMHLWRTIKNEKKS